MPVNPFSFLAQAISDLLNANLGLFESMGLSLFRGLAVILLAWFGVKAALSATAAGRKQLVRETSRWRQMARAIGLVMGEEFAGGGQ